MFSETHASHNAAMLKKLIEKAKEEEGDVESFALKEIYPRYVDECGEAWEEPTPFTEI